MTEAAPASALPQDVKQRTLSLPVNSLQQALPPAQQLPLAPGWIETRDPSGRPLYFNTATGATSWDRPVVQMLPPGWQQAQTPDGKPIFIHAATGTMSYSWPSAPVAVPTTPAKAVIQRKVSVPQAVKPSSQPAQKPQIVRAATMPVTAKVATGTGVDVQVNLGVPVTAIPGVEQAYKIHQISENNNVKVLSKKLASDMAETTTTAASLVTRQVKTVGKTMISAKKMQKACKKVVVQTGALSVKGGRACKVIVSEMVDTADGKGKYAPKKNRKYVPYATEEAAGKPTGSTPGTGGVTASGNVNISLNAGIPSRKPLRKPVPNQQPTQVTETAKPQSPHQMGFQVGIQGQVQAGFGSPSTLASHALQMVTMQPINTLQFQPNTNTMGSPVLSAPPPYHHVVQNNLNNSGPPPEKPVNTNIVNHGQQHIDPAALLSQPMAQLNVNATNQTSIHLEQTQLQHPVVSHQPSPQSHPSISNPVNPQPQSHNSHATPPAHNAAHTHQQPHQHQHQHSHPNPHSHPHPEHSNPLHPDSTGQSSAGEMQQPTQFTSTSTQPQPVASENQSIYQSPINTTQQAPVETSVAPTATITDFSQLSYEYPMFNSGYMPSTSAQPTSMIVDPQQASLMAIQQPTATAPALAPLPQSGEVIYTESTYVDPSSGVAVAQEEIIYVDENGNILADQAAAAAMFVDENGNGMIIVEEETTSATEGGVVVTETEMVEVEADEAEEEEEQEEEDEEIDCDFDF